MSIFFKGHSKLALKIFILLLIKFFLLYCFYSWYSTRSSREIVIIYPDKGATKVKPSDTGGIVVPHTDKTIYENLLSQKAYSRKVQLLPEPEQPLVITPRSKEENALDSIDIILAELDSSLSKTASNIDSADTLIDMPQEVASEKAHEESKNRSEQTGSLKVIKIAKTGNNSIAIKGNSHPAAPYKIQLLTVRSAEAGKREWEKLKKQYPKVLLEAKLTLKRVESTAGTFFYLVMVGDYPTINQAKKVCRKLSSYQRNCIITKF